MNRWGGFVLHLQLVCSLFVCILSQVHKIRKKLGDKTRDQLINWLRIYLSGIDGMDYKDSMYCEQETELLQMLGITELATIPLETLGHWTLVNRGEICERNCHLFIQCIR